MDCNRASSKWQMVRANLAEHGFALFDSTLFAEDDCHLESARRAFIASCDDLPPDRYSKIPGRNRRYGRFLFDTRTASIERLPPTWDRDSNELVTYYEQQGCFNPEHAGERRAFAALTGEQSSNAFLHSLILRCFSALPWTLEGPVVVGAHLIEFRVKSGFTVASSPSNVHCDGEPFTWAMLIARDDIAGGENIIADPDSCGKDPGEIPNRDIRARFTLEKPLQGWVVDDLKVSHYVSPVTAMSGAAVGRRIMLLVDFTPANFNSNGVL
jgi:hypothetical protein